LALERDDLPTAGHCIHRLGDIRELPPGIGFEAASLFAGVLALRGDLDAAETWALHAQAIADRLGRISYQLTARRHVALICLFKGCIREAHALMESVFNQCRRLEFMAGKVATAINLMHLKHLLGALEEAAEVGDEMLDAGLGELWTAEVAANLAVIKSEQGRFDEGEALALMALSVEGLPSWARTSAQTVLAHIASEREGTLEGMRALRVAFEEASEQGWTKERGLYATALAQYALESGEDATASEYLAEASSALAGVDEPNVAFFRRIQAMALATSNPDLALLRLRELIGDARQMGLRLEEGRLLLAVGEIDNEESGRWFNDAEAIFEECGCGGGMLEVVRARATKLASARL
jgi:hypothetical protein